MQTYNPQLAHEKKREKKNQYGRPNLAYIDGSNAKKILIVQSTQDPAGGHLLVVPDPDHDARTSGTPSILQVCIPGHKLTAWIYLGRVPDPV